MSGEEIIGDDVSTAEKVDEDEQVIVAKEADAEAPVLDQENQVLEGDIAVSGSEIAAQEFKEEVAQEESTLKEETEFEKQELGNVEVTSELPENLEQSPEATEAEDEASSPHGEVADDETRLESTAEETDATSKQDLEIPSAREPEEEEDFESHPLDELTDQQVIDLVAETEAENRHLFLENKLFEAFLRDNDPTLLEGLDEMMGFLTGRSSSSYLSSREPTERRSSALEKGRYKLDSYTSITSIAEGKGPKINLSQKTDMVMRAMEESQSGLESFLKKCHITKRNLKSELEEFSIREAEIKEATEIFEYSVVTQGVDKLTQRIPAEKFIRYMEEWLKSAQLQIEKLRLRIATLKVQYKKVSQQLIQRQELGENVHAVDFDQLEIENKHFIEKIDQKNVHLIELKKMNGGANLILSTHKKFLQKQQEDCNKLKEEIAEKNKQIVETEKECDQAEEELSAEVEKYENCRNLKNQYTVPDVMEYVRLKGKLHEIRKNIKIWVRRRKIQDIALNTCLREMKNLTGASDIDPAWFEEVQSISEQSFSEEMLL